MKHIVFTKPGRDIITIRTPAYGDLALTTETDEDVLNLSIARLPEGVDYHIVETEDLSSLDRYFRSAWEWSD